MRRVISALLALWPVTGCRKADQKPPIQPEVQEREWLGFPPYPKARFLCRQHVTGTTMHILWWSYATTDPPADVMTWYRQAVAPEGAERDETSMTIRRGDLVLSIHAASAGGYPDCGVQPRPDERAVFIVSQAIKPAGG